MNLIYTNYINKKENDLVELFISSHTTKKYILGINKFTKAAQKLIKIDGIIDDFSRVQSSKKKDILQIEEVSKDALILCCVMGSPLEVKNKLDEMGYTHFNYLSFYKYSGLNLPEPPFICDFKDDFENNQDEYKKVYDLLSDDKSKEIFEKVINFKISFDFSFMEGFINNYENQYFDEETIPKIKNITFVDGGAYVGDTIPNIIRYFPDFKKIYAIEPNETHLKIAKRDFGDMPNIEFINCGLGKERVISNSEVKIQHHGRHDYQASNINSIDNLINEKLITEKIDYIKLDIEGAEQDAIIGAKNTIKKYKPILAVCVYHKAEDWYTVPKLVLEIESDYDIYLRHYMEGIYETVMYFIPKNKFS